MPVDQGKWGAIKPDPWASPPKSPLISLDSSTWKTWMQLLMWEKGHQYMLTMSQMKITDQRGWECWVGRPHDGSKPRFPFWSESSLLEEVWSGMRWWKRCSGGPELAMMKLKAVPPNKGFCLAWKGAHCCRVRHMCVNVAKQQGLWVHTRVWSLLSFLLGLVLHLCKQGSDTFFPKEIMMTWSPNGEEAVMPS